MDVAGTIRLPMTSTRASHIDRLGSEVLIISLQGFVDKELRQVFAVGLDMTQEILDSEPKSKSHNDSTIAISST